MTTLNCMDTLLPLPDQFSCTGWAKQTNNAPIEKAFGLIPAWLTESGL